MVKPTILVVDDEEDLRNLARSALEERGFTVLEAASGDDALRILESDFLRIDILFTDIVMPGTLSGFALAEQVKAVRPDLAIVLTSGHLRPEIAQAITAAFYPLLPKPYRVHDLLKVIASAVSASEPGKDGQSDAEEARSSALQDGLEEPPA